jgi:hypothetical protein
VHHMHTNAHVHASKKKKKTTKNQKTKPSSIVRSTTVLLQSSQHPHQVVHKTAAEGLTSLVSSEPALIHPNTH